MEDMCVLQTESPSPIHALLNAWESKTMLKVFAPNLVNVSIPISLFVLLLDRHSETNVKQIVTELSSCPQMLVDVIVLTITNLFAETTK